MTGAKVKPKNGQGREEVVSVQRHAAAGLTNVIKSRSLMFHSYENRGHFCVAGPNTINGHLAPSIQRTAAASRYS